MTRLNHILKFLLGLLLTLIVVIVSAPSTGYAAPVGDEISELCDDCHDGCPVENPGEDCDDGCAFCGCGATLHVLVVPGVDMQAPAPEVAESSGIDGPALSRARGVPPGIFKPPRSLV